MFGPLGFPELLFIFFLALLIFGPRKLPEIGRTIGRAMGELRRATSDLRSSLDVDLALEEESTKQSPRESSPKAAEHPAIPASSGSSATPSPGSDDGESRPEEQSPAEAETPAQGERPAHEEGS
jgi:sec-independent protein translocase protein TatA